ncbi:MAG TPA: hypothetical protein VHL52_12875 [Acidimicrobiia bacterium]|nr:hypothetical protein [Acidimicrobiia bacterium]
MLVAELGDGSVVGGTVVVGATVVVGMRVVVGAESLDTEDEGGTVVVVLVVVVLVLVVVVEVVLVVVELVVVVVLLVVVVAGAGIGKSGGSVCEVANAHPSKSPGMVAAAPLELNRQVPPRSAVQYDQNASAGGVSAQSSVSGPGWPSIRQTNAAPVWTRSTSKPAWASASNPVLAVGAHPTTTPPPRSAKSTTTVVPAPGSQAAAAAGVAAAPTKRAAARIRSDHLTSVSPPTPGRGTPPSLHG